MEIVKCAKCQKIVRCGVTTESTEITVLGVTRTLCDACTKLSSEELYRWFERRMLEEEVLRRQDARRTHSSLTDHMGNMSDALLHALLRPSVKDAEDDKTE